MYIHIYIYVCMYICAHMDVVGLKFRIPNIRGTLWEVPRIRVVVCWVLFPGSAYVLKLPYAHGELWVVTNKA